MTEEEEEEKQERERERDTERRLERKGEKGRGREREKDHVAFKKGLPCFSWLPGSALEKFAAIPNMENILK